MVRREIGDVDGLGWAAPPFVTRLSVLALAALSLTVVSCSSSGGHSEQAGSRNARATSGNEVDAGRAELERLLPDQTSLTKQIVADGQVTQQEQEEAIGDLFECYSEASVTPSDPTWTGSVYQWTVSLNTLDEGIGAERTKEMSACEEQHWDYILSVITLTNAPSPAEEDGMQQAVADCITAKGLDGAAYLQGDPSVLSTEEAASCYREVHGD